MVKELFHTTTPKRWRKVKPAVLEMRGNPTNSERILWQSLRREALGVHFRRQHPIDCWIVDFVCLEKRLVVEVDGGIHGNQVERDEGREGHLKELGYRVIRFTNEDVTENLEIVLRRISKALESE
ncbi:MAG: endonuclease domain-containing protein [Deltaproteobacteria bacterium]|nr:endonuclease domain-containing protein [Deltaproteobacteria bacterium]